VENIWELHISALGGKVLLDSINTILIEENAVEMSQHIVRRTQYKKKGGKIRIDRIEENSNRLIGSFCNDGAITWAWSMDYADELPIKVDDFRVGKGEAKPPLFYDHFVEYKEKGYHIELLGQILISGYSYHKIKISVSKNLDVFYFIDTKTNLIYKTMSMLTYQAGLSVSNYSYHIFSNYKSINGLMIPFTIDSRTVYNGAEKQIYISNYERVIINPKIDDKIFKCYPTIKE